jgi:formylmethanofuran dehydrogenase subunit C
MILLSAAREFRYPIIAECISPDVFQDSTLREIEKLKIWEGKRQRNLCELFKIEEANKGSKSDHMVITICGDLRKVRRIGQRMSTGELFIDGDVGMHLGEEMISGRISVRGNVEGWAGAMMKGGTIEIWGNAGDYLGAPCRGSHDGLRGGKIVVHGNAGVEAGAHMKKGLINILGSAGQFAGFRMHGGTIRVQKDCEGRAGACMADGRIIIEGILDSLLPTFTIDNVKAQVKIQDKEAVEGPFYVFIGDLAERGNGKLYISKEKNPHLSYCERFI